ncbi:hypothetical protein AALP_AA3G031000 [Arabis alpina]|uniref:KIB1-4 beta-propeller domain-containing protein n=1 Tax=Arabis alpina TaxID=50452 RepID=A0A087H6P8_ARAAL|nr:hypothetical protein AALP_AA3G031000 [Arabis alpina]
MVIKKPLVSSSELGQFLVPDMIRLVLARLNVVEFHIARSISLDWYLISELCIRQNPTPWLILFPNEHVESINNESCKLYDPSEHKSYTVRDLGFDLPRSRCLANSGSWFLMLDHRTNFHLLNLFTREKIRLPSIGAIDGWKMSFERTGDSDFLVTFYYESGNFQTGKCQDINIGSAVLWVDERSKDYFVVWNIDCFFAYYKKGDTNRAWKVFEPLKNQGCLDMVLKESKLYVLSRSRKVTVFDFSGGGDSPKKCASFRSPHFDGKQHFNNLAVTLSGEVLIIASNVNYPEMSYFQVYGIDPKSSKWKRIDSLGNEALILDVGITVEAKDGVKKNCIYFSNDQVHRYSANRLCYEASICVYNIQTKMAVQRFQHLAASSSMPSKDARWFFATYGSK